MLGRFHEISVATRDIRASVEFYEQLGFTQAETGDAWPHPYGVLTDGRLFIGLHDHKLSSLVLTFVRPGVVDQIPLLEQQGYEIEDYQLGPEVFNRISFRDPAGQLIQVLEARTYSPVDRRPEQISLCGYFSALSLPATDFDAQKRFWEPLGFVATDEAEHPYLHLPLTSDHLNIAFHRPRTLDEPMLVFEDAAMPERIARLRDKGLTFSRELPRGLDPKCNALLRAPEGTLLLLTHVTED